MDETKQEQVQKAAQAQQNEDLALKMYTLSELVPILGISEKALLTMIREGQIKARKLGHRWKVSRANLIEFLNTPTNLQGQQDGDK